MRKGENKLALGLINAFGPYGGAHKLLLFVMRGNDAYEKGEE